MSADYQQLDVPGTFRARAFDWKMQKPKEGSKAWSISVGFLIDEQYDFESKSWVSWRDSEPTTIRGWFYVTKKDGGINQTGVDHLVQVIGWDGTPKDDLGEPPDRVVMLTVEESVWKGEKSLKVGWVDHDGDAPRAGANKATPEDVKKFGAQFGSLLRAAVGVSKKNAPKPSATSQPEAPAEAGVTADTKL